MKKIKLFFSLTFLSIINAQICGRCHNYDKGPKIIVSTICGDLSQVKNYCTPSTINAQNDNGQTALMHSCIHNSQDIFIFLMENKADFKIKDNDGKTSLDHAIEHNRPKMIEFLLSSGADDNLSLDEALKKASEIEPMQNLIIEIRKSNPDINIIKSCIADVADVNARYNKGSTVLMYAAQNGHTEIAKLLLSAGADINVRDNYGFTSLIYAAYYGHTEIAKLLIDAGADCTGINKKYVFILKHLNLFKAAIIATEAAVLATVAGIGYKIWQNFNK